MAKWVPRATVFAALMVVVRLVQDVLVDRFETRVLVISVALIVLFGIAAFIWGLIDGRTDARTNPDPDRRDDLAMAWLVAGLVAGIVSGAVSWLISLIAARSLYSAGLIDELTTFAAFTALVMFVSATLGVAIGRRRVDRRAPPVPRHSHAYDDEYERVGTDVFTAVRDDSPTGEIPVAAQPQERPE